MLAYIIRTKQNQEMAVRDEHLCKKQHVSNKGLPSFLSNQLLQTRKKLRIKNLTKLIQSKVDYNKRYMKFPQCTCQTTHQNFPIILTTSKIVYTNLHNDAALSSLLSSPLWKLFYKAFTTKIQNNLYTEFV